jgi:hypothetical protein
VDDAGHGQEVEERIALLFRGLVETAKKAWAPQDFNRAGRAKDSKGKVVTNQTISALLAYYRCREQELEEDKNGKQPSDKADIERQDQTGTERIGF